MSKFFQLKQKPLLFTIAAMIITGSTTDNNWIRIGAIAIALLTLAVFVHANRKSN